MGGMVMIKVLIVDDEYIMRQGLKYMIDWEQEGFEIVGEATNGAEALQCIETLTPQIIICDIVMPQLDGVDFSEAVHRMYPRIQTIILSGYDKYEYVRHTLINGVVDYILKPTLNPEELRRVLQKAVDRIPGARMGSTSGEVHYEHLVERYLLGHDNEWNRELNARCFPASYLRIFAVTSGRETDNDRNISEVLYQKLQREVEGEPLSSLHKMWLSLKEGIFCILWNYELSEEKGMLEALEKTVAQMQLLCPGVFGILSRRLNRPEDLRQVYQQDILKNAEKAFYYQGSSFLISTGKEEEETPQIEKFDFFKYNHMLTNKQYREALTLLGEYNRRAVEGQMDVYRLKNQIKNMIYHFLDFLQLGDEIQEEYRKKYFKFINRSLYAQDYLECVDSILKEMEKLSGQSGQQTDERIDRMLAYIEKNYKEDLKLEDLAGEFNFNYHYLSAYFSQQMQEGFSDYLNRVRINKACKLLQESTLPISQISSEVGYAEHSYFCRVFKKVTGETPSVWRRNA